MGGPKAVKVNLFQAKNWTLPLSLLPSTERKRSHPGAGTKAEAGWGMGEGECTGAGERGRLEANHSFKLDQSMWDTQMCPPWRGSPGQEHWGCRVLCDAPGTVPSRPLETFQTARGGENDPEEEGDPQEQPEGHNRTNPLGPRQGEP